MAFLIALIPLLHGGGYDILFFDQGIEKPEPKTPEQWLTIMTGEDITLCPQCKEGKLHRIPFPPCKSLSALIPTADASSFSHSALPEHHDLLHGDSRDGCRMYGKEL